MPVTDPPITLTESNPMTQLTLKQLNYVEGRLQGLTQSAAKRAAGISRTDGQIEYNPKVRAAIEYAIKQGIKSSEDLDKNDVISGMMDAVTAAGTAGEMVMAWREIGKLIGAYEPEKKIIELHTYSTQEIKALPDDQLAKLAGKELRGVIEGEIVGEHQRNDTIPAQRDEERGIVQRSRRAEGPPVGGD